ncbi:hypothetical protein C7S16_3218 [Burkholderia thailandensis]|uniref:Uncharacterized protein n=1 Tax=Burkholderia thailandensis TaxID=57975 RepID=A0AAW9D166_BURTH|nr:hypothetical protein [Burkholderia thailandensis]MDW9253764.1 hypothetical protein [Burkholderia thailandensis]
MQDGGQGHAVSPESSPRARRMLEVRRAARPCGRASRAADMLWECRAGCALATN